MNKENGIYCFSGEGQCKIVENENSPFVKFRKWLIEFRGNNPDDTPANRATIEGNGFTVKFNDYKKKGE